MITCLFNLATLLLLSNQPVLHDSPNGLITLNITNVRSKEGQIRLNVFKDEASFNTEKPFKIMHIPKDELSDGKLNASVQLPNGTFGIAVLDDENSNEKMDYTLMMPKEGFGFSNFYLTGLSRPKFDKFKFVVSDNSFAVGIKMRYM